jgi:membrane protease subunit HflC
MNRPILTAIAVAVAVVVILAWQTLYTVGQAQQALVLQLGEPIRQVNTPGLKFKVPFIQNVVHFDKRLLDFDADAQEVIMADQKRLVVDAFARYKIVNPLLFLQTARDESNMRVNMGKIVNSALREVLGSVPFGTVLTTKRSELMRQITDAVIAESKPFGVEVVDVRIMRADLHPDNSQAIYDRMKSERQKEAAQERAEGNRTALGIRAEAERERTIILAEAASGANVLRGQGDAEATAIFARAFNLDAEFYAFYRSLQAYKSALTDGNSTMVLSPDSDFFRYFRDLGGVPAGGGSAARQNGQRPQTPSP